MSNHHFSEDVFKLKLGEKGLKATQERFSIFREALRMQHHFNIDDFVLQVRKKNQNVSRATVYRTLPLLVEFGVLREVVYSEKHHNYECVVGKPHHEHLICLKCGEIIEFSDARMEIPLEEACEKYHFKAVAHKTEVTGYCKKCQ